MCGTPFFGFRILKFCYYSRNLKFSIPCYEKEIEFQPQFGAHYCYNVKEKKKFGATIWPHVWLLEFRNFSVFLKFEIWNLKFNIPCYEEVTEFQLNGNNVQKYKKA